MEGKIAVASVVIARVHDGRWPGSVQEVIFQAGQFSSMSEGLPSPDPDSRSWKESLAAAREALQAPSLDADHFDLIDGGSLWARGRTPVKTIGKHAFYRIDDHVRGTGPQQID